MTSEEQPPAPGPGPTPDHESDGLDFARAAARAAAAASPRARKRSPYAAGLRKRVDPTRSGAHPDERDPQLIGSQLDRVVADRGWALELRVRGVFARWPELVGEEVAAHCEPESFADGRLVVRTDATAWATQLKLLAPQVVRRLNQDLGEGTVTVIEVLGPHLPKGTSGRRRTRDSRGPRDTYG